MTKSASILIVEDEAAIRIGLVDVLIYHGYQVEYAEEGLSGLEKALTGKFDLVLLDVMLPNLDGFTICERIREKSKSQPIIMLTAKSSDEDIINGLTLGADDYVAKPFSLAQLILRIKAVIRRTIPETTSHKFIELEENRRIDLQNFCIQVGEDTLQFTKREIAVLEYLRLNSHRPVARNELLSSVWHYSEGMEIETRTVDIHIARIRQKIEIAPKCPRFLITIRGAGYRLICDSVSGN